MREVGRGRDVGRAVGRDVSWDVGQVSTELLGVLVAVALMIAGLAATGLGGQLAADIQVAVCRIAGGTCTPQSVLHTPTGNCEVMSHTAQVSADVVVFSVDVGGSGRLTLSRSVDPQGRTHWYVQQRGEARLGADLMIGEKAHLGDLGEGASAEVKAFLKAAGGARYEFADEASARDFMTAAAHEPIKQGLTGWDPTGFTDWVADKIDGRHYDPPAPTDFFVEGGGQVDLSGGLVAGVGSVGAQGSLASVAGIRVTPQPDGSMHRTVYLRLNADAAAKLGLFELVQGDAGPRGEITVGLEYDGDGLAVDASIEATGTLRAQFGAAAAGGERTITGVAGLAPKGAPAATDKIGDGTVGRIRFSIDLTQGGNRDVVADGLHSIGLPVLMGDGGASPPGPVDGIRGVYDLVDSGAPGTSTTLTTYDSRTGGVDGGLKGGDVLTFGLEGSYTFEDRAITGGHYYVPGQGFIQWEACYR